MIKEGEEMFQLWAVFVLLIVTNYIGTISYAARLAGVQENSINNSGTLYNALTLVSRLSNMLMLPFLGVIVEKAIRSGDIDQLTSDFRLLLVGSALGVLIGGLSIPFMTDVFKVMIVKLKEHRSLVLLVKREMTPMFLFSMLRGFRMPTGGTLEKLKAAPVSKGFFFANLFIYCIYTVGFLAAIYSGALMPEYRLVSSNLSSAINGFATIALYILIDPMVNAVSDEVMRKENPRPLKDLEATITGLFVGRFAGTLFAQLTFVPVAYFIVWVSQFFI